MFKNPYQESLTQKELNYQLLIGLKKHLLIAQDSSSKKDIRITSLSNIAEVLEYVTYNVNDSLPDEERIILSKFFRLLLTKVKNGIITIHSKPETFQEEISFINILLKL